MKKTITVIGSSNHSDISIVLRLAALGYPLLLADKKWESVKQRILKQYIEASVEMLDCSHECAWQADMILLYHSDQYLELLDKIKNVATGKIIVNMVHDFITKDVQDALPFSKVVHTWAVPSTQVISYTVKGENNQAVEQVLLLFDEIGFKSNQ